MSEALITRDDASLSVTFTEKATALKTSALEKAGVVGRVSNADEQQKAVEAQQEIAGVISLVEKARVACKAPILDYGRKIDDSAKKFVEEVKEEQLRLARLVGDFQALEQAKAQAAERARRLEEERIEREKQAAIMKAAREAAEAQRAIDEAAATARRVEEDRKLKADQAAAAARRAEQEATNKKEREAAEQRRKELEAQQEKERIEAERRRIELETAQARATAQSHAELDAISSKYDAQAKDLPPVSFAPTRAQGQRVTNDWEVTVSDIHALYRHHPNCVELKPRLSEIKDLLKGGTTPKGVVAKPIVNSGVTTRRPMAIDV